jgi:hypothetical protein
MRLRHILLRDGELLDAVLLDAVLLDIGFACRRSENALPCGNFTSSILQSDLPDGQKNLRARKPV